MVCSEESQEGGGGSMGAGKAHRSHMNLGRHTTGMQHHLLTPPPPRSKNLVMKYDRTQEANTETH